MKWLIYYLSGPWFVAGLVREALRRGEGGGAGRVGEEGVAAVELVADAQVRDLDQALRRAQQVGRLDVAVDDLLVVNYDKQNKMYVEQRKWRITIRVLFAAFRGAFILFEEGSNKC